MLSGTAIGLIWNLDAVHSTFVYSGKSFAFLDNMEYYFDRAELIFADDFEPNTEDILKMRCRTTAPLLSTFTMGDNQFQIVDLGGQRNERRKWIYFFESVSAVIFVAALNDYNKVLFEDENKNAMHESIQLFTEICNGRWFRLTEMILFLNKNDLFREMLRNGNSLKNCFHSDNGWYGYQWDPDNTNDDDIVDYVKQEDDEKDRELFEFCYEKNVKFIQDQYIQCNVNPNRLIFVHITTATNYDIIEKVFWDAQNIIILSNLKRGALFY